MIYKDEEQTIFAQMNAFYYYKTEGLETVQRIYPDQLSFVIANKERDYEEVKIELLNRLSFLANSGR